jgi:hypothetical protein
LPDMCPSSSGSPAGTWRTGNGIAAVAAGLQAMCFDAANTLFAGASPDSSDRAAFDAFAPMSAGFLALPVKLLFTRYRRALQGRDELRAYLHEQIARTPGTPGATQVLGRLRAARTPADAYQAHLPHPGQQRSPPLLQTRAGDVLRASHPRLGAQRIPPARRDPKPSPASARQCTTQQRSPRRRYSILTASPPSGPRTSSPTGSSPRRGPLGRPPLRRPAASRVHDAGLCHALLRDYTWELPTADHPLTCGELVPLPKMASPPASPDTLANAAPASPTARTQRNPDRLYGR